MIKIQGEYLVDYTTSFKKQYKKMIKRGKKEDLLKKVVTLLANNTKLPEKYKDHELVNDKKYKDCRECHIEPDWLLVYKKYENELILLLTATGSHSDLF